jgi:hypothetical protein
MSDARYRSHGVLNVRDCDPEPVEFTVRVTCEAESMLRMRAFVPTFVPVTGIPTERSLVCERPVTVAAPLVSVPERTIPVSIFCERNLVEPPVTVGDPVSVVRWPFATFGANPRRDWEVAAFAVTAYGEGLTSVTWVPESTDLIVPRYAPAYGSSVFEKRNMPGSSPADALTVTVAEPRVTVAVIEAFAFVPPYQRPSAWLGVSAP